MSGAIEWGLGETLFEAVQSAARMLEASGVEEARNHAELLLLHVLQLDRSALLFAWHDPFPPQKRAEWAELLQRKATGEPIQYMIGSQWFYGREFHVSPSVLIPRPETELLVEAVLKAADELWPQASSGGMSGAEAGGAAAADLPVPTIVDVGTGSGAIAVTLAAERHGWQVCASDLSEDALRVARGNAAGHGVSRIAFLRGDLLAPLLNERAQRLEHDGKPIDVLVSNPPYIPAADMAGLQREVRDFEPHLALEGGTDGLDPYRSMLQTLARLAVKPRIVAFELGIHQPRIVAEMMKQLQAWDDIRIITDYGGIERHIIAVKRTIEN